MKIFTRRYAMPAMSATAAVVVIAAMATTSCSKTDELSGEKTEELSGEKGNVITTINASAGGDDQTKVYFTPGDGNIFHVTWKTNDKITVINDAANTSAAYTYGGADNAKLGEFNGNLSANSGNQLFAFYNKYGTVNAADNSITVNYSYIGATSPSIWTVDPTNKASSNSTNNSLMYASATAGASGTIPLLNFKNANAIVKLTFGGVTGDFNTLTFVSADGGFPIAGKATVYVESGETKVKWSNLTYGGYTVSSGISGAFDFSYSYGNVVIPGTYGALYYLISDDALATATSVYYINTSGFYTEGLVTLKEGLSYGLNKSVTSAAIINSSGSINDNSIRVWINQAAASTNYLSSVLSHTSNSYFMTVIQANTDATSPAATLQSCTNIGTYINNYSTALSDNMFQLCPNLRHVSLANVTALPDYAFAQCNSLQSVFFPKVTTVGNYAFSRDDSLNKIRFGSIITDTYWRSKNVFYGTSESQIDLVLKTGQAGVSGNTFNGYTFKSITFED